MPPERRRPGSAGGRAAAAGERYRDRIAAWLAVQVLAEEAATSPWDLAATTSLERLRCESASAVDDIEVTTSDGGRVWIQAKHSLKLETTAASPLASALDQCVRQFRDGRGGGHAGSPTPLDPRTDRLVIATSSPSSSSPVCVDLPRVLERIRSLPDERLDAVPVNAEERKALDVLLQHVRNSWRTRRRNDPDEGALRAFLEVLRIWVIDVEPGEPGEREALNLLRAAVLVDASDSDAAWALLDEQALDMAATSCGADRSQLQRVLFVARLHLQAVRSFREDVLALEAHSAQVSALLKDHSSLPVRGRRVRIRRDVQDAVRGAAEGHLLVVGEPGAGKTAALHALYRSLKDGGARVVFLSASQLAEATAGSLKSELGLTHGLLETLGNWPGAEPGYLLIDALDGARGGPGERTLRDVMRLLVTDGDRRWHVIASVREFDLRYKGELHGLFAGAPPTEFSSPEFADVRHVHVPRLSDGELAQLENEAPDLHAVVQGAPADLREILRVPFNLEIAADLLADGEPGHSLRAVTTQLELLDRHWLRRVVGNDGQGVAREAVLAVISDEMIRDRRLVATLKCIRDRGPQYSEPLDQLLGASVLVEFHGAPSALVDRTRLQFSHHILFDFAVAYLRFRDDPGALRATFAEDQDAPLMLRPSIVLHLQHLWHQGPAEYWRTVFPIMGDVQVSEIHKTIAPAVAADLIGSIEDLRPVLSALEATPATERDAAEAIVRHVFGALVARPPDDPRVIGVGAGPWCEILDHLSERMAGSVPSMVDLLLQTVCERADRITPQQRSHAGRAARNLLRFRWSDEGPRDSLLVQRAVTAVCKTFGSDPAQSASLLRRALQPEQMCEHGPEELSPIVEHILQVADSDPEFAVDVYAAAFAHQEESSDPTRMGTSRIMSLLSNRKQDHEGNLFLLQRSYPEFLRKHTVHATRALLRVPGTRLQRPRFRQQSNGQGADAPDPSFEFACQTAHVRKDYSSAWDDPTGDDEEAPGQMLNAWQSEIRGLCADPSRLDRVREIVELVAAENRAALVWARLLQLGASLPETLGVVLRPLAWAVPLLACGDTAQAARGFVQAVFSGLPRADRERVERTVVSLPSGPAAADDRKRKALEATRDRLLLSLPEDLLVTEEARRVRAGATPTGAPAGPERPSAFRHDIEYARNGGEATATRVLTPAAQRILDLQTSIAGLIADLAPALASTSLGPIVQTLKELRGLLPAAPTADIDQGILDGGWRALADACSKLSESEINPADLDVCAFLTQTLAEASRHRLPRRGDDDEAGLDDFVGFSPEPRAKAASGLMHIARRANPVPDDVGTAIRRLAADPVTAVRFEVAHRIAWLFRGAPDLMWELLRGFADGERSGSILKFLLEHASALIRVAPSADLAGIARRILLRVRPCSDAHEILSRCGSALARIHVLHDDATSREAIDSILVDLPGYQAAALGIAHALRAALTHGSVHPRSSDDDAVRARAIGLLRDVLGAAKKSLAETQARLAPLPASAWPEADKDRATAAITVADGIAREVYYASGAFGEKTSADSEHEVPPDVSKRLYREAKGLLEELADVGHASVAHHLVLTLAHFVPFDPRGVFLLIGRAIREAEMGGYQLESLGAGLVVGLVGRYLADYRSVLLDDAECRRTLREVLDVFVRAGWPEAIGLTYRLWEIFR